MTWTAMPYLKGGLELDRITVEGISATGYHGVLEEERRDGQVFVADVVVHTSTRGAAARDDLALTVNYADVAQRVHDVITGEPCDLIETVAERCAHALLEMRGVACVDIRIHKPKAPIPVTFADTSVTIRRDEATGGLWANLRIGSSAGLPQDPTDYTVPAPEADQFDRRPLQPVSALLALGGNIGDVQEAMRDAIRQIDRIPGIHVEATSALVKTPPAGGPDQPDYLNAVVRVSTMLSARELLAACHGIEMVHGRERDVVNGPRTLDIDVIDHDATEGVSADLILPHPRAAQRSFVLVPWWRLEPKAELPGLGAIAPHAASLAGEVEVVAEEWLEAQPS